VPLVDVRPGKSVCFSFRRHRSLVHADRAIFFVPSIERLLAQPTGVRDVTQWQHIRQVYHENLQCIRRSYGERLASASSCPMPFEFQLGEIILDSIARQLTKKSDELRIEFDHVSERAYARITVTSLRELALLKEDVDKHKRNAELALKALGDLLAHDEDLVGMYLTDNRQRDLSDHVQVELLLEASTKQMAEVCRLASDLSDSVVTLESAVGFMLDAVRNELLAFEIRINIITMGLALGALIAGVFGMNVITGMEQHPQAFVLLTAGSVFAIGGVVAMAMKRLLRYRKVRLHRSNKLRIF
jgi:magnesium transporter